MRARVAVAAVICAVVASACGVPAEDSPRAISEDAVQYDLLQPRVTTSTTDTTLAVASVDVPVYLVRSGERRLVEVSRTVTQSPTVNKAINALLDGPTEGEIEAGYRTSINPNAEIEVGQVEEGTVRIDLSDEFGDVPPEEQLLALAQLVYTATAITGVSGVRFTRAGEPIEVPLPEGTGAVGPVGREAFESLGPPQG